MNTATDGLVEYNGSRVTPERRDELEALGAKYAAIAAAQNKRFAPSPFPKSLDPNAETHRAASRRLVLEAWDKPLSIYERDLLPTNATPEEIEDVKMQTRGTWNPRKPKPDAPRIAPRAFSSQEFVG